MRAPEGWLATFLEEAYPPDKQAPSPSLVPLSLPPGWRLRRALLHFARRRGLRYGAPLLREGQRVSNHAGDLAPLIALLAVLVDQTDLVSAHLGAPLLDPRAERRRRSKALAAGLALAAGYDDAAAALVEAEHPAEAPKALSRVAKALVRRRFLVGNPLLGLTLNHALAAAEAQAVGEAVALTYGARSSEGLGEPLREDVARRREALVAAIASLSAEREELDHALSLTTQVWHVKNLGLPRRETQRLLAHVKAPPDVDGVAALVRAEDRELVVEHALLAALLDGRVSPEERRWVDQLVRRLELPLPRHRRLERRVAAFVAAHREAFNPLAHAERFHASRPPLAWRATRLVRQNLEALFLEVRETGDLAVLLARRAAGQRLSDDEQRRMREQLVDVAKAVPSLALFSLPGGAVLLPVLLKLLPFDLRTSAFRGGSFHAFDTLEDTLAEPPPSASHDEDGADGLEVADGTGNATGEGERCA